MLENVIERHHPSQSNRSIETIYQVSGMPSATPGIATTANNNIVAADTSFTQDGGGTTFAAVADADVANADNGDVFEASSD